MKKFIILTLLLAFMYVGVKAQVNNLRIGPQVTPTFSWMKTNDNFINGNGMNLGTKIGLSAEYHFSSQYAIVSGLNWAFNTGGKLQHDVGGNLLPRSNRDMDNPLDLQTLPDGVNIRYHLQYLEIPIALKMRTKEFGYLRYYFQIPEFYINFLTKARGDIMETSSSLNYTKQRIGRDVIGLNMFLGLGAGIEYSVTDETSIIGGLHYQQSFIDVTKNRGEKNTGVKEDSKGSIGMIMLKIGVLF